MQLSTKFRVNPSTNKQVKGVSAIAPDNFQVNSERGGGWLHEAHVYGQKPSGYMINNDWVFKENVLCMFPQIFVQIHAQTKK